ncbi:hypothetical protein CRP403_gp38 [Roseobacter phage CRP-403]|uniref:Uncharacterized protein n=1 Tax=Roseobacter phage CRP-403 TaxID=3072849 RepID=A0AAX3ZXT0_9CAUD|nr:hypothetical protein CRP403_gp38 [Roseobacter phage CRP-403]
MLAELAACNAAFQTIKTFVGNGKSIADCAQQISTIVSNKEVIEKKLQKKRSGFMANLKSQTATDLEEFLALEKIKEHEAALKQLMIYQGRGGMWDDFVKFQAEARKRRRQEKIEADRKREELVESIAIGVLFFTILAVAVTATYFIYIR